MIRDRVFLGLRIVAVILGVGFGILGMPHCAVAQQDKTDDDVEDVSGYCDEGYDCQLESYTVIYDTSNPTELDVTGGTAVNEDALDDGYDAYVCAAAYQDDTDLADGCEDDYYEDGDAELDGSIPLTASSDTYSYSMDTDSYLADVWDDPWACDDGDPDFCFYITSTGADVTMGPPQLDSISPPYVFVGAPGSTITMSGENLINPFGGSQPNLQVNYSGGSGSGLSLSSGNFNDSGGGGTATAQATQSATTGIWDIGISYTMGSLLLISTNEGSNGLTVGDPTPSNLSVSSSSWSAGSQNVPITITGTGFGTSPALNIIGPGVTYTSGRGSDTSFPATVSVDPCSIGGTASITVTSTGYLGTGFAPAYSGQSSSGSTSATVLAGSCPSIAAAITDTSNIVNGIIGVQLTGTGQSGQLTISLTDRYGQVSQLQPMSNVQAGSQNIALDLSTVDPDLYIAATASWQTGAGTADSPVYPFPKSWPFFGYVYYTQYNIPAESQCSGGQTGTAFIVTPQCTFTQVSLTPSFIQQTWINGTGTSLSQGILKNAAATGLGSNQKCAGKYPKGAIGDGPLNGNTFAVVNSITGSCGTTLTNNQSVAVPAQKVGRATRPVPLSGVIALNCGNALNLDAAGTNTPQYTRKAADLCPGCGEAQFTPAGANGHVDSFNSSPACSAHAFGSLGYFYSSKTN